MSETIFNKSPDITSQIPPGPTVPFKVVNFPDQTLGQTFVPYNSNGEEITGMAPPKHDYISVTYPSATQEVYVFKVGGSGGTTVGTITLNYTDATKASLSNAART